MSPVFGTLGNSDAGLDYFMPITSNESVNPWFSQIGGSIEHAGLMTQGELQEFKHGGFFQAREGNLSILSLDTVIYAMDHLPIRPLEADPFGQFAWLRQRLREAATAGQKVWIVGHVPPGIETFGYTELWHPQYVERRGSRVFIFLQLSATKKERDKGERGRENTHTKGERGTRSAREGKGVEQVCLS